jgi:hypothetical protein
MPHRLSSCTEQIRTRVGCGDLGSRHTTSGGVGLSSAARPKVVMLEVEYRNQR